MTGLRRTLRAAGAAALASSLGAPCAATASAAGDLSALRDAYLGVRSVHVRAQARIEVARAGKARVSGLGSFEYWWDRGRYRIECRSDPALGLANDVDIAYDGARYQYFERSALILSYQAGEPEQVPTALPNPWLLAFEFLSREGDACPGCRVRHADLADEALWRARYEPTAARAPRARELEIAAGTADHAPLSYRVSLDGAGRPRRIDRIAAAGASVFSIRVRDYIEKDAGGRALSAPKAASLRGTGADGSVWIEMQVDELTLDAPVEAARFSLDAALARSVWDGDARRFVREPSGPTR